LIAAWLGPVERRDRGELGAFQKVGDGQRWIACCLSWNGALTHRFDCCASITVALWLR